jgi:hypothetical protein
MWINVNPASPTHFASTAQERVLMESNVSDFIVGLMMAVFGLIGLFLVAGAADAEMYVFGLALSGFAVCFEFGLLKRHFDRRDAVRAVARSRSHA